MSKQISVHNHMCTTPCEHADICYLVHGKHYDTPLREQQSESDKIEKVIDKLNDKHVYYSGCNFIESFLTLGSKVIDSENRSMTFSKNMLPHMKTMIGPNDHNTFNNKVQLTVYTYEDIINPELKDMQKIFLIKDDASFEIAIRVFREGLRTNINKIHFPIEHEWSRQNQGKIILLIGDWNRSDNKTLSLDSCLENYLVHNKCVYKDNYIDLRFDGSVRRCPFSDECHPINYDNPEEMFDIPFTPTCIWHTMFYKEE